MRRLGGGWPMTLFRRSMCSEPRLANSRLQGAGRDGIAGPVHHRYSQPQAQANAQRAMACPLHFPACRRRQPLGQHARRGSG